MCVSFNYNPTHLRKHFSLLPQFIWSNIVCDCQSQLKNIFLTQIILLSLSPSSIPPVDREDRLRLVKDRQNEERQRKLEELKAQAVAAQKYREQKEDERRRRIDDLRSRENDRKQQVDERKRAIQDAEKDRRDYILRKNQVSIVIENVPN